jgi:hypothetical protein
MPAAFCIESFIVCAWGRSPVCPIAGACMRGFSVEALLGLELAVTGCGVGSHVNALSPCGRMLQGGLAVGSRRWTLFSNPGRNPVYPE